MVDQETSEIVDKTPAGAVVAIKRETIEVARVQAVRIVQDRFDSRSAKLSADLGG